MDNINICRFISNIENIYQTINIYRSLIIIDNNNQNFLIKKLKEKFHYPIVINNINDIININYNYRLFILNDISLLKLLNKNNFNFIAIY